LTTSPTQKYVLQFNIQNNISTFVPKQLSGPPSELSYNQQENIEVFDSLLRAMIEDFNEYEVDSKTNLKYQNHTCTGLVNQYI
jgi:hypothetical protein